MEKLKLKLIKKAWDVVDPNLWESGHYSDGWIDAETVYAETRGQAKQQCEQERYLDVKCRRNKSADLVEYDGRQTNRGKILAIIAEEKRRAKRRAQMEALPEDDMYYIQSATGYVGNSIKWWGLNGNGYVIDPTKAQKYTKAEVVVQFADGREEDVVWCASHVEKHFRTHVDMQYLDSKFKVK